MVPDPHPDKHFYYGHIRKANAAYFQFKKGQVVSRKAITGQVQYSPFEEKRLISGSPTVQGSGSVVEFGSMCVLFTDGGTQEKFNAWHYEWAMSTAPKRSDKHVKHCFTTYVFRPHQVAAAGKGGATMELVCYVDSPHFCVIPKERKSKKSRSLGPSPSPNPSRLLLSFCTSTPLSLQPQPLLTPVRPIL
jgi:hypothetical protein